MQRPGGPSRADADGVDAVAVAGHGHVAGQLAPRSEAENWEHGAGATIPARMAVLRAAASLKLPDCCALLAAVQMRGALATFDDRLANAATERKSRHPNLLTMGATDVWSEGNPTVGAQGN